MTLEDLGNLAELVAAIGVIVTLAYLALQIRQNTRALKSTVFQNLQTSVQQLVSSIADDFLSHPGLRRYWERMHFIYSGSFQAFVEQELLSEKSEATKITVYRAGPAA